MIELLTVIAIVSLLAAILFPVFGRVREKARTTTCASNLRQIGLGLMQYAQDNDETFPTMPVKTQGSFGVGSFYAGAGNTVTYYATSPYPSWISGVYPYVKSWQLFRCPSTPSYLTARPDPSYAGYEPSGNSATGYIVNGVAVQRKLSAFRQASSVVWAREYYLTNQAQVRPFSTTLPGNTWPLQAGPSGPDMSDWLNHWAPATFYGYHNNGQNLLFCDGHAKWRANSTISSREFGLNGDIYGIRTTGSGTLKIDANQVS